MKKNNRFRVFEGKKANDRHIRLTEDMIVSEAWKDLKATSVKLYISLKLRYNGENYDSIEFPYSEAEKIGISKNIIKTCFDDLIKCGFIEMISCGRFSRTANIYKLSNGWREYKAVRGMVNI